MNHQDWAPVTLSKKSTTESKQKDRSISQQGEKECKLEAPSNLGPLIAQGRTAKKMTQKLLANKLGIAVTVLSRVEAGKELPANATIARIERAIGVQLPRAKKVALTE